MCDSRVRCAGIRNESLTDDHLDLSTDLHLHNQTYDDVKLRKIYGEASAKSGLKIGPSLP